MKELKTVYVVDEGPEPADDVDEGLETIEVVDEGQGPTESKDVAKPIGRDAFIERQNNAWKGDSSKAPKLSGRAAFIERQNNAYKKS